MKSALLTRNHLAKRWLCSTRKVDRLRKSGQLAWIDLTGGKGKRPVVRFKVEHILEFEKRNLMDINRIDSDDHIDEPKLTESL